MCVIAPLLRLAFLSVVIICTRVILINEAFGPT